MAARVLASVLNPALLGPDNSGLSGPSMVKLSKAGPGMVSYPGRAFGVVAFATTPGKPRGIMKPRPITPEFQEFVGAPEISRTQALKVIWAHIKANNLQDPKNKKIILCDEKLKKIFAGKESVGFLEISGLISPHLL